MRVVEIILLDQRRTAGDRVVEDGGRGGGGGGATGAGAASAAGAEVAVGAGLRQRLWRRVTAGAAPSVA